MILVLMESLILEQGTIGVLYILNRRTGKAYGDCLRSLQSLEK